MQETRYVKLNNRSYPVLISDEKEALLAAHAAGGAIVGLWGREKPEADLRPARYLIENPEDADDMFLERVVRRNLGLPWKICETERLLIREICGDDFTEIWDNQVGHGFSSIEELEAYTKHQYEFYGFGFWALKEKAGGELIGIAGLRVPDDEKTEDKEPTACYVLRMGGAEEDGDAGECLELGYHIFAPYRRQGYALEATGAVLSYAESELQVRNFCARISGENAASRALIARLGFR